jgi:hypothetical protein
MRVGTQIMKGCFSLAGGVRRQKALANVLELDEKTKKYKKKYY